MDKTNKQLRKAIVLFILLLAGMMNNAKANHAAGGEISYEWISDSTYRIYFKFYRDCVGATSEPSSINLCYRHSCGFTQPLTTLTLNKVAKLSDSTANGSPVSPGCPPNATKCQNASSTVPGYREWWYTNTVTLRRCSLWTFSVAIQSRNAAVNLQNAQNEILYVEATLNNEAALNNSSPIFSVKPVASVCVNQQYSYNNGGIDPNSDSVIFEIIQPLKAANSSSCPSTVSNVPFATGTSPAYNTTNNPLQTNATFVFDTTTGQMTFTPILSGSNTLTVKAREYRNNVLIGTVMRDIQVSVISCNIPSPVVTIKPATMTGAVMSGSRVHACAGVPMSFCYDLVSPDTGAVLVTSDNHVFSAPGSSTNYVGTLNDSIRGCFTWTPGTVDTGLRIFTVTAKDSTCIWPGVSISQTYVLPIYISPVTDILKDTAICYGDSVQLTAVGGSNFTWSVLSGGSSVSSLSCTTCKQPYVKPSVTTQYVVENTSTLYCTKTKDTATVAINNYAGQKPTASSNSPICVSNTLNLSATMSGFTFIWSGPSSFSSTSPNPSISNAQTANSGYYYVRGVKNGCLSGWDTMNVIVSAPPSAPTVSNDGPACTGSTLTLSASGGVSGATYNWTGPNSFSSSTQNPVITNVQNVHAGSYSATITYGTCTSSSSSTTVTVKTTPSISTVSSVNIATCGGTEGNISLTGLSANTTYSVNYKKNNVSQTPVSIASDSTGKLTMSGLTIGTYSQVSVTLNGCTSDTVAPIILTGPKNPTVSASSYGAVCQGDNISLYGSCDSSGVVWAWTGPGSFSSSLQNPSRTNAVPAWSGTYSVTATKHNCTSLPANISVTVTGTPSTPVAGSNSPLCSGDNLNLTSSTVTGATYTWTGPNGFTSSTKNPVITNIDTNVSGVYSVIAKINGCPSAAGTTTVNAYKVPVISSSNSVNPATCSGTEGSITVNGLKLSTNYLVNHKKNGVAQTPVTIQSNASGSLTMSGLNAGVYSNITVTLNGCTSDTVTTITLTNPPTPVVTAGGNLALCEGDNISLSASANLSGVTWSWTGPGSYSSSSQNPVRSGSLPSWTGTYSVTATKNNCTSVAASTSVNVTGTPATPVAGSNTPLCAGNTLTLTASSVSGASYSWTGPNSFSSSLQNPAITNIDTIVSGIYTVIASIDGCPSAAGTISVTAYQVPTIGGNSLTHPITCGGTEGSITLTGLKNSTSYLVNYRRNGVAQTPATLASNASGVLIMSDLNAATYSRVTVTLNGCTSDTILPVVLVNPTAPTVTAGNNTPICETDSVKLTASSNMSGVSWAWVGPNGYSSSIQNPNRANGLPEWSGNYSVTATKNNCTSIPATTTVLVKPTPATPVVTNNGPLCSGGSLVLTASTVSGATYRWFGPNAYSTSVQNPVITNVDTMHSGIYTVIDTVNGCISLPGTTTVSVFRKPVISTYSHANPASCNGTDGVIILNGLIANVDYTVNYKKNGVTQTALIVKTNSTGNLIVNGMGQGSYSQIKVSLDGCTSDTTDIIVLTDPVPPTISATYVSPVTCSGNEGYITLSGLASGSGYAVYYDRNSAPQTPLTLTAGATGTVILPNLNSATYTNIKAIIYNCVSNTVGPVILSDPAPPTVSATGSSTICERDTINLSAASVTGATYSWTGPGGYTSTSQNPAIANATPSQSGTYYVTAKRNNCNSLAASVAVLVKPSPTTPVASGSTPLCSGNTMNLTASAITGASYNWTGPASYAATVQNPVRSNVASSMTGNYTVVATVNGCQSLPGTVSITVLSTPTPDIGNYTTSDPSTCNGADGSIIIEGQSTSTMFVVNYKKNGIAQSPRTLNSTPGGLLHITNLTAAVYTSITVTAPNGCTSDPIVSITLIDPVAPTIAIAATSNPVTCSGANGSISLSGLTANSNYIVNYSRLGIPQSAITLTAGSTGNVVLSSLTAGSYSDINVTINNCISNTVGPVTLTDPTPPVVTASSNVAICQGDTIKFFASGAAGVSYTWTGPGGYSSTDQNPIITNAVPSQTGTYSVVGILNNCTSNMANTTIIVKPTPATPVAGNSGPVCEATQLALTASVITGATYIWNGPSFNSALQNPIILSSTPANSGTYGVVAIVNGCISGEGKTTAVVYPTPALPTATTTINYCEHETPFPLYATGNNLLWYTVATGGTGNATAPTPSTTTAGSTTWYVSQTINGCEGPRMVITVNVHAKPVPPIATPSSYEYCQFSTTSLLNATGSNLKWYDQKTGGVSIGGTLQPSSSSWGVIRYYVSQTSSFGCESDRTEVTVRIDAAVKAEIKVSRDVVCQFDTITVLDPAFNPATATYDWNFDAGSEVLSGSNNGPYIVKWNGSGTRQIMHYAYNGVCFDSTMYTVQVKPSPRAQYELSDHACLGDSIELKPDMVDPGIYNWSFGDGIVVDTSKYDTYYIKWLTTGDKPVSLSVTGSNGCVTRNNHIVHVHELPVAKIESVSKREVCTGDTITLSAQFDAGYSYKWADGKAFIENNTYNVSAMVVQPEFLYLNVENIWGCTSDDSVFIMTQPCCTVFFPDAFTPNGDGKNDFFRAITRGNHDVALFVVVDRWGKKVFESRNSKIGWDGTFNGVPLEIGTYNYYIKYTCSDTQVLEKKGEVILIR
jgi:gliding motility-associated-like protein